MIYAIDIGNTFFAVSNKDLAYIDEKEFRLFYWALDKNNQSFEINPKGVNISTDINKLIEKIYINPTENIDIETLEEVKNRKNFHFKIINSRIRGK